MSQSKIYYNITTQELIELQKSTKPTDKIIVKFSAVWCAPCKKINPLFEEFKKDLCDNHYLVLIDIEESIDIYMTLKKYKMVNGIPAILVYNGGEREHWYISDYSVLGGDENRAKELFTLLKNN